MFNVNLDDRDLLVLKDNGYCIEHNKNIIALKNEYGSPVAEIIYIEEFNELLVMTEKLVHWNKRIRHINIFPHGIIIEKVYIYIEKEDYKIP